MILTVLIGKLLFLFGVLTVCSKLYLPCLLNYQFTMLLQTELSSVHDSSI